MLAIAFLAAIPWIIAGIITGAGTAAVIESRRRTAGEDARRKILNTTALIGGVVIAWIVFVKRKKR